MSGYNELKNAIRRVVKTNNNREITGQNLQSTLTSMVNSLGANYHFAGFASPDTNPGTPDQNIFYIASEEGTYVNFDGINLEPGLSFLMWNGKWSSETMSVGEVTKSWVQQNYVSIAFFNELFELYNDSTKIAVNDTIPVDKAKLNIKAMFGFWTEQYISALGNNDSGSSSSGVDMATVWSALAGSTDEQINKSHITTALSEYATMSWASQIFATVTSIPTKLSQLANDTGFITSAALPTKVSQLVNDAGYVTASVINGYATQSWVSQNYVSVEFFERLFQVYSGTTKVDTNSTSAIDNIKAMFGFWTEQYISALGNSDTTGGGSGGLMGSIVPYAKAITLTTQNEGAEIASAWSVKMLYDKIETIDASGQLTSYLTKQEAQSMYQPVGNYLTGITKSQVEGVLTGNITSHTHSQYLTSHQSLSGYATEAWVNAKGYITSSGSCAYATNAGFANSAGSANNADTVDGYHAESFFRDLGWWASDSSHYANDIKNNGAVFAYNKHYNTATTGVLVTFVGGDYKYAWQMQKSYYSKGLFVRGRNGDTGEWLPWEALACITDISWSNLSDKPTTFAPSSHTHKWAEITDRITKVSQLVNDAGYVTSSASITGNAGSATRLQTERTIWGQRFDGTGNVSGTITGATTITASGKVKASGFNGNFVADETVFYFGNSKNVIGSGSDAVLWAYSGHNILFYTKGSNRMTIENGGNVGIGTQSPQDKLHVVGGARVTGTLVIGTSSSCDITFNRENSENFINVASGGSLWFYTYNYGTTGVILSNGNWGIGTSTPSYKLHVNGDMATTGRAIVDSLQIGNITIIYDAANKGLRIAGGGLYTDSYLSSLGVDASTALSVKKWADSINLTEESDAELATAYSIGNLYRLINNNQKTITESLNQSVGALQGRCTSLEQRVSALENKVN